MKIKERFVQSVYQMYEQWILPPQNISLLELKKKEFKERTKYLDLKVLYNLSDEEKSELRQKGYFVDLDEKSIHQIQNFNLTYNRHQNRYQIMKRYYNMAIFNDNYYRDQFTYKFEGDPQYQAKLFRARIRPKRNFFYAFCFFILMQINYRYVSNIIVDSRKSSKEIQDSLKKASKTD